VLGNAHTWFDRHPVAGDAGLAAVLLALALSTFANARYDATPAAIVVTVLLVAPLVLRRRAPVAAFAAIMLGCAAELLLVDKFLAATGAALIALYTLVAYAPRAPAAAGYAITLAGAVAFALRDGYFTENSASVTWLLIAAQLTVAAALGDRRRARVRDRARLEERARLLAAELEHEAALAAAAERARIAREPHDIVAHSLSVVVAQADGGRYAADRDPAAARTALTTISTTARDALAEMRRAVGTLRDEPDAPLRPQPGAEEVGTLVARTRAAGLPVELTEEGRPRALAPAAGLAIYRVAQEALTNVLKHAGRGASAHVTLRWEPEQVTVVVRDDGTGAPAGDGRGRGLAGMRERVEPRGGTVTAGPRSDGGFEVRAVIPAGS
jgi:signal transduction histidine kinase